MDEGTASARDSRNDGANLPIASTLTARPSQALFTDGTVAVQTRADRTWQYTDANASLPTTDKPHRAGPSTDLPACPLIRRWP